MRSSLACLLLGLFLLVLTSLSPARVQAAQASPLWGVSPTSLAVPAAQPSLGWAETLGLATPGALVGQGVFGPKPTDEQSASADWNRRNGLIWTALGGGLVLGSAWLIFYVPFRIAALASGNIWTATMATAVAEFVAMTVAFGAALVLGVLFLAQGIRYLKTYDRLQGGRVSHRGYREPPNGPIGLSPPLARASTTPLWSF